MRTGTMRSRVIQRIPTLPRSAPSVGPERGDSTCGVAPVKPALYTGVHQRPPTAIVAVTRVAATRFWRGSMVNARWTPPAEVLDRVSWRCIGPYRAGRVVAVAGHPTKRNVFYFGSTGGGVWRTDDAGVYWKNISDGFFKRAS